MKVTYVKQQNKPFILIYKKCPILCVEILEKEISKRKEACGVQVV